MKLPFRNAKELKTVNGDWHSNIQHEAIVKVDRSTQEISFSLNREKVIRETFENPTNVRINDSPRKFIVEFSSPNIAKPFHMGHLRSTIIGNFLSNLFTSINNNVVKMNYLGDYGTQFGFLKVSINVINKNKIKVEKYSKVGIEMEGLTDEQIKKNPLECLFKAYVTANISTDPDVAERARKVFEKMENNEDKSVIDQWEQIKSYTMDELKVMYERLNVVFDAYEFESMYRRNEVENVIAQLSEKNLITKEDDGRLVVNVGDRRVPIVKSDSTTLYLTRDIAAFLERKKCYEMDKIFYVVDNGQNDHFTAIKSIVGDLGFDAGNLIHHVKFGRIKGMSTRKGSVVFLKDILDEAKDLMFAKQHDSASEKFKSYKNIQQKFIFFSQRPKLTSRDSEIRLQLFWVVRQLS